MSDTKSLLGLERRAERIASLPPHSRARSRLRDGATCRQGHGTDFAWRTFMNINAELGIVVEPNGANKFRLRCTECQCESADMPSHIGRELITHGTAPTWGRKNTRDYPPCSYTECAVTPTEFHHFAPTNTFGDDADNWPVMPLCRHHHQQWHTQMDGYRWHARRVA